MKKIIITLITSALLVSCSNNTPDSNEVENQPAKVVVENNTNSWETENNKIINTENSETWVTETPNTEKKENSQTENKTNTSTWNNDEAVLETEVNDLLDEFIDSLDEYDK